jgi:hypothetical protein
MALESSCIMDEDNSPAEMKRIKEGGWGVLQEEYYL